MTTTLPKESVRAPAKKQSRGVLKKQGRGFLFQIAALIAVVFLWWLFSIFIDKPNIAPPPSEIGSSIRDLVDTGYVWDPLAATLTRTALGFLLGFVAGTIFGVMAARSRAVREYSSWIFDVLFYTPSLIIIFVGLVAFGRSDMTAAAIVGICIFTDVATYVRDGLASLDRDLLAMADSYHASAGSRVRDIYIPFAIPAILAAGRIGFSLAWKVAFLAEVFGVPNGLGWELRSSYRVYDIGGLIAWLCVFIIVLLIVEQVVRLVESVIVRWRV